LKNLKVYKLYLFNNLIIIKILFIYLFIISFLENKNKIITEIKNVNTSIEQVHHEIKRSNSYDFYQNSENIINNQLKIKFI